VVDEVDVIKPLQILDVFEKRVLASDVLFR